VAPRLEEARAHRRRRRAEQLDKPHHDTYDDGLGDAVWDVVQTLPRKARAVVVLRYYEEMSEAETRAVLGISVGTVKSQASRALATLPNAHPRT
jgi:RNA polymerase sigma factor (sigma-70 family)